jgi:uncharacterized protein YcsI (UPF0317 family)
MTDTQQAIYEDPAALRQAIRAGSFCQPTAGQAPGYVQTNLVIVPRDVADDFAAFCAANSQACPLIARCEPGDPEPGDVARGSDLRTDVPRYRVFRHGVAEQAEPHEIRDLWRSDLVSFLLGCSFTFERALAAAGLPVRHIDQGRNVPMYRTKVRCQPAGPFAGSLVVSMRPYGREQVDRVQQISGQYPRMHGAPVHVGDPAGLGIKDLARPDFGQSVTIEPGELPVFWACGVTPQLALENARLELAITHSPGYMFVTDLPDTNFRTSP